MNTKIITLKLGIILACIASVDLQAANTCLVSVPGSPFAAGSGPTSAAYSSDGKWAAVANSGGD